MPVINVEGEWLNRLLGREYAVSELADALEQMGCDVDDVLEVERFRCPRCGMAVEGSLGAEVTNVCNWCEYAQSGSFASIGKSTVIRLDLLAARPDLFDVGGIARALRGYLGLVEGLPEYEVGSPALQLHVDPSVDGPDCRRPHIRAAVVELPAVDDVTLVSLMKLQEALHWGVGRDRKLASIGVYDLSTLTGPLTYTTLDPDGDVFEPLGRPGELFTGRRILEEHPKGVAYARLLADHRRYPVLRDATGAVLSMPPIINSESTKVRLGTRQLFIDVTGPSLPAVVKSLDTFVSSLLELGGRASAVEIVQAGRTTVSPDLAPRTVEIDLPAARRWLGVSLTEEDVNRSLRRMRLDVAPSQGAEETRLVRYPALRTDFKHMVDVFEDLAIGYGYRNIPPQNTAQATTGLPRAEEVRSELVRSVLIGLGFSEIMSLPMTTEELHFEKFREPVPARYARIGNPKLKAMTVVRSHLMTGLMEHLRENRRAPLPLRFFELDNVTVLDPAAETGAREQRRVCLVEMGKDASYASMRSIVDALLFELGLRGEYVASTAAAFIPGRVADVSTGSVVQGRLGELHPETILNFGLDHPVALAELTLLDV